MDDRKFSSSWSAQENYDLAVKLASLDPSRGAPDRIGTEVRRALVKPLIAGMGRQPVRDQFTEAFGDETFPRWAPVDPRYLEVIATLFNVDLDWLTGRSNTPAPYSRTPLALAARVPKSREPIVGLRSAALTRLGQFGILCLGAAFMCYSIIAGTVFMAARGDWAVWTGLLLIVLSALFLAGICYIARSLYRSARWALSPMHQLGNLTRSGLRLHLAEKLHEYLSAEPGLASGEIAAVLHGSLPVDEDLIARLCSPRTRTRKGILHAALSAAQYDHRSKRTPLFQDI
jgi:hypothetical protein